ncbi:hypothetical protein [Sphingobium sp. Z007]|uniref:hypothetical protein n=1 Tax=Sphingobium sp. Z007 TaxID=627495 RepID=UPI001595BB6B|nr:hypothetical protein [Sphingobium sp. Z007]
MADTVNIDALPDSGSPERVAFDLLKYLAKVTDDARRTKVLDQYAECLEATAGKRVVSK